MKFADNAYRLLKNKKYTSIKIIFHRGLISYTMRFYNIYAFIFMQDLIWKNGKFLLF